MFCWTTTATTIYAAATPTSNNNPCNNDNDDNSDDATCIFVILFCRKHRRKCTQTSNNLDDYANNYVNPNNDTSINPYYVNGTVNPSNTEDSVVNTYERLQHSTVQYANTTSTAGDDHVYLHITSSAEKPP